mmetsp:Transcript_46398/g.68513  ORF Transcript_46398/g.68513 Transcript_46398/m.68513 type:complete len:274 (+) Transcript_46398:2314-3135(+)
MIRCRSQRCWATDISRCMASELSNNLATSSAPGNAGDSAREGGRALSDLEDTAGRCFSVSRNTEVDVSTTVCSSRVVRSQMTSSRRAVRRKVSIRYSAGSQSCSVRWCESCSTSCTTILAVWCRLRSKLSRVNWCLRCRVRIFAKKRLKYLDERASLSNKLACAARTASITADCSLRQATHALSRDSLLECSISATVTLKKNFRSNSATATNRGCSDSARSLRLLWNEDNSFLCGSTSCWGLSMASRMFSSGTDRDRDRRLYRNTCFPRSTDM